MFFALRGRKVRHIGGFLESRRDDRPQTGAQASGYDATTKEATTERQRHRLFLSPFQGFVLLMSQSRGFHPLLWSFAPSVLHLGTAINTMNSLRDCKSLYPMRADCKSARTAADGSLLHRLLGSVDFFTPRSIDSHSTEYRPTLHGVSGYTPRSIGSLSTEYRLTLHGVSPDPPRGVFAQKLGQRFLISIIFLNFARNNQRKSYV